MRFDVWRTIICAVAVAAGAGGAPRARADAASVNQYVGTITGTDRLGTGSTVTLAFEVDVIPGDGATFVISSGGVVVASGVVLATVSGNKVSGVLVTTGGAATRDPARPCCQP